MDRPIPGIHHVTAIAGDPQQNLDFYASVLGLRLVKLTINFDDPGTYHLYYGNETGSPGTILTFFPWPGAPQGRLGTGQTSLVSFAIPAASLKFWMERLKAHKITFDGPFPRFDEPVLAFADPDHLQLELIATSGGSEPWRGGSVPAEHAIRGFHSVTLSEEGYESTAALLTSVLGFRLVGESGNRFRYVTGEGHASAIVDVLCQPELQRGVVAVGTVHHIAWRALEDAEQRAWRHEIGSRGYNVTPILDRNYFHSIYFREPGGVLFEIATDPPGFSVDEPLAELGQHLKLPSWLEPQRAQLEHILPKVKLPKQATF
ncbi:MAG: ring-cleaving dioxygenase [Bryobacterales bacterium]|nr:ring-cleaving dioxygenase [Bryobacterales bacterium]